MTNADISPDQLAQARRQLSEKIALGLPGQCVIVRQSQPKGTRTFVYVRYVCPDCAQVIPVTVALQTSQLLQTLTDWQSFLRFLEDLIISQH